MTALMHRLRNLPIRQKLILVILLTCSTVLVLALAALFVFQTITIKAQFIRDLSALGQIIAHNSAAAVALNDREAAAQTLSSVDDRPDIKGADLVLANGEHVTRFDRDHEHDALVESTLQSGCHTVGHDLLFASPVLLDGQRLGTLYLRADLSSSRAPLLKLYGGAFALVLVASLLVAFVLASRWQRFITAPILHLAEVVQRVGEKGDYTVRATKAGGDEVGVLTDAFNEMLSQIQRRDARVAEHTGELAHSLRRLHEAQRLGQMGDWERDLATQVSFWSPQVFEIVGRDPRLGPPQTFEQNIAHYDAPSQAVMAEKVALAIESGEAQTYELVVVRPDGVRVPVQSMAVPRKDESGRVVALYGTIQDISARKRAEARLRRLLDSNVQGVMFWNKKGEITEGNEAFLKLAHYTREDLEAGRINWAEMTPPEYADLDRKALEEIAAQGFCATYEKEWIRKDGKRVPILIGAATFEDAPDEGVCFVLDLTERKKLEAQFLRAQRMEGIGTLAGGIAHDLNNVFAPIMMALELLAIRFPDADSQKLIATIAASAQHGAAMVRQVLSFARGVEGERVEAQVKHLIEDIEKIARDTFPKDIVVCTAVARGLWTVLGDPTQLHQVLLNLCVNARDAMPNGGTLTLSAENCLIDAQYAGLHVEARPGPYLLLEVEDNGTGIPAEVVEKIFEPFFTTKEFGKGTGLGLSTSMAIVKSHGGFIRVYSELRTGTKFQVYLPAQTTVSAAAAAEVAPALPRGRGELILVVDDEASVRQITQQTLQAFGYRVVLACDGAEAVATFACHRAEIAAVLTDMMMPLMDGPATIRALRKLSPELPMIGASGLSAENHVAAAARLGIKHFLPKPYTAVALLKALQQILPAKREPAFAESVS